MNLIFFGITRVNSILEVGKRMELMKDRNLVKELNMFLKNIDLKVFSVKEKEMVLVF